MTITRIYTFLILSRIALSYRPKERNKMLHYNEDILQDAKKMDYFNDKQDLYIEMYQLWIHILKYYNTGVL